MRSLIDAVTDATRALPAGAVAVPARFAMILRPDQESKELVRLVAATTETLNGHVQPLSPLDRSVIVLELPGRVFHADQAACFSAAYALSETFNLDAAEPDLATGVSPDGDSRSDVAEYESLGTALPGCFAPKALDLDSRPLWALQSLRVPEGWEFSESKGAVSKGAGVVVAQPDTGITDHPELQGVTSGADLKLLDGWPS